MSSSSSWSAKERVTLLLAIVPYVLEHGPTPIVDLAAHFGVAPSLVRRLARFIGTAGIPGESLAGLDNDLFDIDWGSLLDRDVLDITRTVAVQDTPRFSGTEAAALLAGLALLRSTLEDQSPELARSAASAADKLAASTNVSKPEVSVDETPLDVPSEISLLTEAIETGMAVSFTYEDRRGIVSARTVLPHHIMQGPESWYLRGFCVTREGERIFRLESIEGLRLVDGPKPTQEPGPAAPVGRFPLEDLDTHVQILVYPDARYLLERWSPTILATEVDGRLLMSVALVHPERVIELVCIAPTSIEVVQPPELRQLVHSWAQSLVSE